MRYKVNFLQYLLHQDENSLLYTMLRAQQDNYVRGDWFSETIKTLHELQINMNIEEIRKITRIQFKKLSKIKSEEAAFNYLIQKQETGSKGRNLLYSKKLEMANYLCPNNNLSVENQRQIFQIRSRSNPLLANRGIIQHCSTGCGKLMDNIHILECVVLNQTLDNNIEMLTNGSFEEMQSALKKWNDNLKKLEVINSMDSVFC